MEGDDWKVLEERNFLGQVGGEREGSGSFKKVENGEIWGWGWARSLMN